MSLGTTTWKKRNEDKLLTLLRAAKELNFYKPDIIHIGPGGAVNFMTDLLPEGQKENWTSTEKAKRIFTKAIETSIRHTNLFALNCPELHNLLYTLADLQPNKIYVFDLEKKVVEAASKLSNYNGFKIPVQSQIINIETQKINMQAEIVVAYNVLNRVNNIEGALKTICAVVKQGGLLSINHEFDAHDFQKIEKELYRKV